MNIARRGLSRRDFVSGSFGYAFLTAAGRAAGLPAVGESSAEMAPFSQVKRIVEALQRMGEPLSPDEAARILGLAGRPSADNAGKLGAILDKYILAHLTLDKSGLGECTRGGASPQLAELGWRSFLVRVDNPAKLTGPLVLMSRSAIPEGELQPGIHDSHVLGNDVPEAVSAAVDLSTDYDRDVTAWMGYRLGSESPGEQGLEGVPLEYQILQLYSQLGGQHAAPVALSSVRLSSARRSDGKGFVVRFACQPATTVRLSILDSDGRGSMASLVIRDEVGRLYPAPAHRLEPDLGYQPQIYRADGETLRLAAGRYRVRVSRGPEYLEFHEDLSVSPDSVSSLSIRLERWIDSTKFGWYPGDPHIHPEGQVYGIISKYGLTPETLFRQVCGEGLSVGSVLIWAGGYYYEKQFLTGHVYQPSYSLAFPEAQRANNESLTPQPAPHNAESLIRYDAEQAAFPSNRLGHLVLLRLKNHDFPGVNSIYDWPSWNLPILQWARAQGAVNGYAHISLGTVTSKELPNYDIPAMIDLGANECLVDVTHGLVDFVAGCEHSAVDDLNPWYHLLNCGFPIPMIGETDFLAGRSRVGSGRTYVKLENRPIGDDGYSAWVEGLRAGRVYFGDGRSHLIDFKINEQPVGAASINLRKPGKVILTVNVACRLEPNPFDLEDRQRQDNNSTYWHIERARIGSSRNVLLEAVVNGHVTEQREVLADATIHTLSLSIDIPRSSWIALRILSSGHTAPLYVSVGGKAIRASRRSAQWCLDCIEVLWNQHAKRIRVSDREAAAAAWEHAREVYRRIRDESAID
jgi:hypothetical protein